MAKPARFEGAEALPQHLVWRTKERKPYLAEDAVAETCLRAFEKERPRLRLQIIAFALMPDHAHLLVAPTMFPPGTVVQWLKLASAYWVKEAELLNCSPWARGYWDRAIRDAGQLRRAIKYIHNNPVAAGLVDDIAHYRYSSYRAYHETGDPILTITPVDLL